jgi:L-amino acid N-acyltransferase YncA
MTKRIRLAGPGDAAAVAAIYAPAVIGRAISFEFEPPDAAEMARRIAKTHPMHPWLVAERDGEVVGYAYAGRHRERDAYAWSVDVSTYVHPDVHRAGVGRGVYTALFAILALQGYRTAFAGATLPNPGSVGLHTAMGFRPVGVYEGVGYKLGRWHDVAWFARPLLSRGPEPEAPRPLDEVAHRPEFAAALVAGAACMKEGGRP